MFIDTRPPDDPDDAAARSFFAKAVELKPALRDALTVGRPIATA
jgi:hypothetical protein